METSIETPIIEEVKSWDDLSLNEHVLRSIYNYGFENPSEIQRKAIKPILTGKDVIAQAQSGTGKTGAFVIGSLCQIDVSKPVTQVIILAPTHELVNQIHTVVQNLSMFLTGFISRTIVGGTSINEDIQSLRTNVPHLIVG